MMDPNGSIPFPENLLNTIVQGTEALETIRRIEPGFCV